MRSETGGPGDGPEALNLKQVAARLGVHYMTAYRYVRQGRLDATMVGGTWMVDAAAIERFDGPERGDAPAGDRGDPTDRVERIRHLLCEADETEAWRLLQQLVSSGASPRTVLSELLPRALDLTGGDDPTSRAREAVATATAGRLVDRLAAAHARPGRSRGTVLLAAPTGEQHRLPIATVGALVRIGGFRTVELGADVDPEIIAAAVGLRPVLAVGIGVTTAAAVDPAAAAVAAIRRDHPDVPVVLGGQAVRNALVARMVGTEWWAADGDGMVALLDRLVAERTRRRRAARAR